MQTKSLVGGEYESHIAVLNYDTGYPNDGRADNAAYPHNGHAAYPHDRHI